MFYLPSQYHWSPSERREEIFRNGLKPYCDPVTHSGVLLWPYICLSPSPKRAWQLSGDFQDSGEIEQWDLWQVELGEHDEVSIRSEYGSEIMEVRVRSAIPADRVWHVATRGSGWSARCSHGGYTHAECPDCFPDLS